MTDRKVKDLITDYIAQRINKDFEYVAEIMERKLIDVNVKDLSQVSLALGLPLQINFKER